MPDLNELISALYAVRQQKSDLERREKLVMAQLKPLADPEFDTHLDLGLPVSEGGTVIHAGDLDLSRQSGVTRSISADLLLSRGVAADVIASATKTTPYFKYLVKKAKE